MRQLRCYSGSVNRWECDENDHMNVRFFLEKHTQCLQAALSRLGCLSTGQAEAVNVLVQAQHLRFVREARLAAPLVGMASTVELTDGRTAVLTELLDALSDDVLASCVHELAAVETLDAAVPMPAHAGSRGVPPVDTAYANLTDDVRTTAGFREIGRGVIQPHEVDSEARLALYGYMGRLSDSMPHLWALLRGPAETRAPLEGGAVLEYRLQYHERLRAGDGFAVHSGLAEVGTKVQQFVHLILRGDGRLAATAQAVGVRMDLATRRAMTLDETALERMRAVALAPLPALVGETT